MIGEVIIRGHPHIIIIIIIIKDNDCYEYVSLRQAESVKGHEFIIIFK